jgi:hypothetical protein
MAAVLSLCGPAWGGLEATIRSAGDYDPHGCGFWGDSLILSVTDQGREIAEKKYCSAYAHGAARVVTDALGHPYVLLEYSEGHGTNAFTGYLVIYRLADQLIERERVRLSIGAGPASRWSYEYTAETPTGGGLRLLLQLSTSGVPEPYLSPPPATQTVAVDTVR